MNIKKVCERYDLTHDTLRYYEKIGLIAAVERTQSGIRNYSEKDCERIEFIKCMRQAGLTIEILSEYIGLVDQGDSSLKERRTLLMEQRKDLRKRMDDMQKTLDRLDYKVKLYDERIKEEHLKEAKQ